MADQRSMGPSRWHRDDRPVATRWSPDSFAGHAGDGSRCSERDVPVLRATGATHSCLARSVQGVVTPPADGPDSGVAGLPNLAPTLL